MKNLFAIKKHSLSVDIALTLVRVVMGYAFVLHGWGKIQTPFSWMGPESPVPGVFQALAALSEFGGGIVLILGLLTTLSTFGLTCTMLVAAAMHKFVFGDPFVATGKGGGSYELAAIYLVLSVLLFVAGPGRFSADRTLFGNKN